MELKPGSYGKRDFEVWFISLQAYRDDANAVFNETFAKTTKCVDDRIAEVTDYTNSFTTLVNGAVEYSNRAIEDMKNCSEAGNFVTIGSCLGSIALQTDMKAIAFTGQVGLMVRLCEEIRINNEFFFLWSWFIAIYLINSILVFRIYLQSNSLIETRFLYLYLPLFP